MAVDLKRLAAAAVEAALNDERPPESNHDSSPQRSSLGGLRGIAAGAAVVAAARFAAKRAPSPMSLVEHLPKPDLSELGDRMRDRIDEWFGEEDYEEPEEDDLVAEEELDEEDDEPEDVEDFEDGDVEDEADVEDV